jgi:hypothetical protein
MCSAAAVWHRQWRSAEKVPANVYFREAMIRADYGGASGGGCLVGCADLQFCCANSKLHFFSAVLLI